MPSFLDDLSAFTEALGPQSAAIVLPLSLVDWPDAAARDEFISGLLGVTNPNGG